MQGRSGDRLGNVRVTLVGSSLLCAATLVAAATSAWHLPAWAIIGGWALAGAGMGLMHPRLTVLTLASSTPQDRGFSSSALSISDSIGASAFIAVMGLTFVALRQTDASLPAVFLIAAALTALAVVPGLRMGRVRPDQTSARPIRQYPMNATARRSTPRSLTRCRRSVLIAPASPASHA